MSGTPHGPGDDKAFEEYLDGRSPLGDSYERLKNLEPPEELDRMILEQAREAAAKRSATPRLGWFRWVPAAGLATVLVGALAVLIVPRVGDVPYASVEETVNADAVILAKGQASTAVDQPDAGAARQVLADSARLAAEESPLGMARREVIQPAQPGSVAVEIAAPPSLGQLAAQRQVEDEPQDTATFSWSPGDASEVASDRQERARAAAPRTRDDGLEAEATGVAKRVDIEGPAPVRGVDADSPDPAFQGETVQAGPTPARVADSSNVARSPAASLRAADIEVLRSDPDEWLAYIDRMLEAGKLKEARDELEAFRERYPDVEIDERYDLP